MDVLVGSVRAEGEQPARSRRSPGPSVDPIADTRPRPARIAAEMDRLNRGDDAQLWNRPISGPRLQVLDPVRYRPSFRRRALERQARPERSRRLSRGSPWRILLPRPTPTPPTRCRSSSGGRADGRRRARAVVGAPTGSRTIRRAGEEDPSSKIFSHPTSPRSDRPAARRSPPWIAAPSAWVRHGRRERTGRRPPSARSRMMAMRRSGRRLGRAWRGRDGDDDVASRPRHGLDRGSEPLLAGLGTCRYLASMCPRGASRSADALVAAICPSGGSSVVASIPAAVMAAELTQTWCSLRPQERWPVDDDTVEIAAVAKSPQRATSEPVPTSRAPWVTGHAPCR